MASLFINFKVKLTNSDLIITILRHSFSVKLILGVGLRGGFCGDV
jgi:hypothetical protein